MQSVHLRCATRVARPAGAWATGRGYALLRTTFPENVSGQAYLREAARALHAQDRAGWRGRRSPSTTVEKLKAAVQVRPEGMSRWHAKTPRTPGRRFR